MQTQILELPGLAHKAMRFGAVGAFVCSVDLVLVWLLSHLLAPAVAVSVAYLCAAAVHFTLNKWWVFQNRNTAYLRQLFKYGLTVVACWVCTVTVFSAALHLLTSNIMLAKLTAIPPATLLAFLLMKLYVFPAAEGSSGNPAENSGTC